MNPQTRNLLIQRVIDSLGILGPGSTFERFGVILIERMNDIRLVQRGSSVGGSPVGGALDAVSEDGRIVVEASILKGYFAGEMKKPWSDLDHALELAPSAEDIYLLSSQRAATGVIEGMVNTALLRAPLARLRLHLMDSRAIAEVIIDTLMLRDEVIDDLAHHLPVLAEIRDDHPASLKAPPLSAIYVRNGEVDAELDRRLEASPCVEIGGIGGIGKSQTAAACLLRSEGRFEYRFWVSGRDIDSVERLSSVPLQRGGSERNISALLRRNCTFLVIDDASPSLVVEQLATLCGPHSRILITRQIPSTGAFAMPTMNELQARELLGKGLHNQPSLEAFKTIWRAVGGHPLSLVMLNVAAQEGVPWNELAEDCANVASLQTDGARLADRILGRLKPALEEELCLFQWAGQSHCDRAFFKYVIGPLRLRAFERHGLTAPEAEASIRIHDIVFTALKSSSWLTDEKALQIDDKLEAFILQQIREDGHGLRLIASQLKGKIASSVEKGDRRPAFLYALSLNWMGSAIPVHLLPNPQEEALRLKSLSAADNEIAILVVLESIEAKERFLRQDSGQTAVKWLGSVVQAYDDLRAMADLNIHQTALIKHHHAKTLLGLGKLAEAENLFEEVVARHSLNDAKLQLVRLVGARPQDYELANRYASEIIASKLNNGSVSPSLLMALGDALNGARQTWASDLIEEHEELFLSEALYSAAIGIPQGYHSVASFVRALIWHAPERVDSVLARLPEPTPLMLDDDQSRGGYAEIMMLAAGIDGYPTYLDRALEAFETLKSPNRYQKRKWGEALYKLGRYAEAEIILDTIEDKSCGRIWLAHNLSQVKLELGKFEEALDLVNESVEGATGVNEKYLSSFLLQRVKVKIALHRDPAGDIAEGRRYTNNQGLIDQFSAF